ncbi:hypothetical protein [Vibrio phage vB_VmeM-Yong XC32]|nr:hypothetical protein [Vibrio phage vB_VmeM-Yong XC31]QAX96587.1 hypothetical protein [Vibrio phage vB_VmeM-Yong XC32]QAX96905.1 hypothetical protein [Vibrio phage vB_VmeM-Yong MS31]QAX97210.1 hypothetical protein [Vibrio phage vB_VmeM-Yong MS32]
MNESIMAVLFSGAGIMVGWAISHYLTTSKAKKRAAHYKKRYREMVNQSLYINTNATVSVAKALAKLRPIVDELEKIQNAMPKDAEDIARMNMKEEGAYAAVSVIANALLEPYRKEEFESNEKPPKDYVEDMSSEMIPPKNDRRNHHRLFVGDDNAKMERRVFDGTNGNGYQPEYTLQTPPPGAD